MATLHKAVFDMNYHTWGELCNLTNDEIIKKVKEDENAQVSAIYTLDEYNTLDLTDCVVLNVMI